MGLPFATGVRRLDVEGRRLSLLCEHDDGLVEAEVDLPAALSVAERLCEPAKVDATGRSTVAAWRIRRRSAHELGAGPWGDAGSPTRVGQVRPVASPRAGWRSTGSLEHQLDEVFARLMERGAVSVPADPAARRNPMRSGNRGGWRTTRRTWLSSWSQTGNR